MSDRIENRYTGVGEPWAILKHGKPLNSRQQELLDKLPEYDSRVTVGKDDVSMKDLSALTAKEGVEFSMFTRGSERLVVRGDERHVNIDANGATALNAQGYKWSGHTHVGLNLAPSAGDRLILRHFNQATGLIYNAEGGHYLYGSD